MRKATKILLLISEILCWVGIGAFIICGIVYLAVGANEDLIREALKGTAYTQSELEAVQTTYIALGVVFMIIGLICIATGILSHKIRKAYLKGGAKADFKKKAIALIVLGALSNDLCIVPAIFLLAQREDNFKAE